MLHIMDVSRWQGRIDWDTAGTETLQNTKRKD
nr:MAG TPA: hypothetical protein [Bacteriophage sp.]